MHFVQKVVIVTGASSGIGAATAIMFAQNGANVAIVGRNENKLNEVAKKCELVGIIPLTIIADMSKDESAQAIIKTTVDRYGKLDILVNNAGVFRYSNIRDDTMMKVFDEVMRINLRAHVALTKLAVPYLIESKGNIINISSTAGSSLPRLPNNLAYSVSKAGLDHFGRVLARDLAPHVRVNTVSPGPVKTDIMENYDLDGWWDEAAKNTALGRVSESEDIAELVMFLASDKAKGITGSNFDCDNGMKLR